MDYFEWKNAQGLARKAELHLVDILAGVLHQESDELRHVENRDDNEPFILIRDEDGNDLWKIEIKVTILES